MDGSAAMLDIARDRIATAGLAERITLHHVDVKASEFSEAQFMTECVLSSLAFIERIEAARDATASSDDDIPF